MWRRGEQGAVVHRSSPQEVWFSGVLGGGRGVRGKFMSAFNKDKCHRPLLPDKMKIKIGRFRDFS